MVSVERIYFCKQKSPNSHLNGDKGLLIVGHGDKTEAFALVRLQVPDHLHNELMWKSWSKKLQIYLWKNWTKRLQRNINNILITLTFCTAPNGPKSCQRMFSSVSGARLYTKMHHLKEIKSHKIFLKKFSSYVSMTIPFLDVFIKGPKIPFPRPHICHFFSTNVLFELNFSPHESS